MTTAYQTHSREQIDGILQRMGFSSYLKGYRFLADAIYEVTYDRTAIYNISRIYEKLSAKYQVSVSGIERSIRTVILRAWSDYGDRISDFISVPLRTRPTIKQIVAAVSNGINMMIA